MDEQDKNAMLGHIVFEKGVLRVPKNDPILQKMLSLYHPHKGYRYEEYSPVEEAKDDLVELEQRIEALNAAKNLNIDEAEAIVRVNVGSSVANMTSKEIKRDLLVFASNDPELFLELAADENVNLRNIGLKGVEANIIKLSNDQRTFQWVSNGRKLMTVPFDENPYSALAAWFKTDEGVEVFQTLEKRLK